MGYGLRTQTKDSGMGSDGVHFSGTLICGQYSSDLTHSSQVSASRIDVEDLLSQSVSHGHEHRPIERQELGQKKGGRHQTGTLTLMDGGTSRTSRE
jgi:hypothetical protein